MHRRIDPRRQGVLDAYVQSSNTAKETDQLHAGLYRSDVS